MVDIDIITFMKFALENISNLVTKVGFSFSVNGIPIGVYIVAFFTFSVIMRKITKRGEEN